MPRVLKVDLSVYSTWRGTSLVLPPATLTDITGLKSCRGQAEKNKIISTVPLSLPTVDTLPMSIPTVQNSWHRCGTVPVSKLKTKH